MIEKYHTERRALIQKINQTALNRSVKEKEENDKIKVKSDLFQFHSIITCPQCASSPLFQI